MLTLFVNFAYMMEKGYYFAILISILGFPGVKVIKNPPVNAGDTEGAGLIPGWKDSLEEKIATHSSFLPGRYHGQRSLVGCISHGAARSQT